MRNRPETPHRPDDPRRPAHVPAAVVTAAVLCIAACESSQLVYLGAASTLGLGNEALLARATPTDSPAAGGVAAGDASPAALRPARGVL